MTLALPSLRGRLSSDCSTVVEQYIIVLIAPPNLRTIGMMIAMITTVLSAGAGLGSVLQVKDASW